ncbi:MAG: potassium-transporting ATPase subunit F [Planctomycetes bacterium]|nr:potassium-transporting ATPase subunit F [Planctomycetota bacterium]
MRATLQILSTIACFAHVVAFERAFERLLVRVRPHDGPKPDPVAPMTAVLLLLLAVAAFVYLLVAVLRPEKF